MIEAVITRIFQFGPLLFGIGFLAPLIAELIQRAGISLAFGMSPLIAGLLLGGGLGVLAQWRGSWIWLK